MKNILLATTALVMTAGFASAEVKFSGKAEGGVTRTAATKAVAAVAVPATGLFASSSLKGTFAAAGALSGLSATDAVAIARKAVDDALILYNNANTNSGMSSTLDNLNAAKLALDVILQNDAYNTITAATTAVAAGDIQAYSGYDFDVSLSAASDNGITFAAGFDMGAGYLADTTDDLALELQDAVVGAPTVSASMNGYTVAFKKDGISDVYDDSQKGDVSLAGTVGTVTFKIVHGLEADTAAKAATYGGYAAATHVRGQLTAGGVYTGPTAAVAAKYETTSYTLGTTVGGIGLSLTGTDANDHGLAGMKAKATYALDALTFGLETNNRGDSTGKLNANKVSVAYAGEGVSASVSSNDDKDWDLSATLSSGANSATFVTDEDSAWNAQVASDLGGGASVFGYVDHTELFMAGVRFKF